MALEGLTAPILLALLALPIAARLSPWFAQRIRAGQRIRPEGPAAHQSKAGTPTMGGAVPLMLVAVAALLASVWGPGPSWSTGFVLLAAALGAGVGLVDDLRSQQKRTSVGFFPRQMLLAQTLSAGLLCLIVPVLGDLELVVPFSSTRLALSDLPVWAWVPLVVGGFVGTVNGVNLADGLDGLATGAWLIAVVGLGPVVSSPELRGLSVLALGAGSGFLWANAHPARVFLGNVGSMGLGGLLFGLAFTSGGVLFLPLVGGLFVLEVLSVVVQVASYKLTGVRLLKMAPFHHHLDKGTVSWPHRLRSPEWPEPKVVVRLWILGVALALVSVAASAVR